jgi:hypothetical protein
LVFDGETIDRVQAKEFAPAMKAMKQIENRRMADGAMKNNLSVEEAFAIVFPEN